MFTFSHLASDITFYLLKDYKVTYIVGHRFNFYYNRYVGKKTHFTCFHCSFQWLNINIKKSNLCSY
jgi:hypothetical protein